MVGDRNLDVLGAHKNGLRCIGILYGGYGTREELEAATGRLARRRPGGSGKDPAGMKTVWRIVRAPFRLVAWLGRGCLNLAGKAIRRGVLPTGRWTEQGMSATWPSTCTRTATKRSPRPGKLGIWGWTWWPKNTGFLTLSSANITPNPSPAPPSRRRWPAWPCTAASEPWWSPTAT